MRDLTGQRFGRLVAVSPSDKRANQSVVWNCHCDCGNDCQVPSWNLTGGRTRSCGCLVDEARRRTASDLAGERFGRLVVVERAGSDKRGRALWKCRCDCGNECEASTDLLKSGKKRSCGCLRRGKRTSSAPTLATDAESATAAKADSAYVAAVQPLRSGARFGSLIAVDETGAQRDGSPVWRCVCDCDRVIERTAADLESGRATSCGLCSYAAPLPA